MTEATGTRVDEQRLKLLHRKLAERGLSRSAAPAGETAAGSPALSDGQRRMWFVQSMDPHSALLNVCVSYRLTGGVDTARLHQAADAVAVRHPVLRTTYYTDHDGELHAVTHADLRPGWAEHDLSALAPQARRLRLEVLAQREFARPFDLAADPPLRITVVRVGQDEVVLLLTAHHIAWDDGSWSVFFSELTGAYTEPHKPGVARPSAGAAATDAAAIGEDLAYWRAVLSDPPEPLELPGPGGSVVPSTWRSRRATVRLQRDTVDRAAALARDTGATPYMVLLAAFGALVHRYTHAGDFLVATPVLNRGPGTEDAIGYYGNTVAMRLRPHPRQTFRQLLADTRDAAVGAFTHQRVDLHEVVREFNPDRRYGAERMTRVSFGLREPDGGGFCPSGVECERDELRGQFSQLPLSFMIEPAGQAEDPGALVEAEYLVEVLDRPLVQQLLEHYAVLLDSALTEPDAILSRLDLMSQGDAAWLRSVSVGADFVTPATTLTALVQRQVEATPDAVAVVYEGRRYSYREINEEANRVAHWLIARDVGAEDRVAVVLDKSPELVVTALGILKAGAVYLPVDPSYPEDRCAFIIDDSAPKLVLREPVAGLHGYPVTNPDRFFFNDRSSYVIYTSGSAGLPKGVPVPHAPVAEYFVWFGAEYSVDAADRLLQVASPSFDVSIGEIFGTLICGARLVIPRLGGLRDIGYLTDLLHRDGITSMHFVPSLLGLVLSLPGVNQWRTLRRVPVGGEALPGEIADKFHATFDALLYNFYGPTETVINATSYRVKGTHGARIVPIGKPKINTEVHLLDDALQPVPAGVIGEIYIGGTHVAHGYHRRPALTAERFVADPFNFGGRLYRSGDLARRNADGDIEFVGRADEQVKIRGFRVELGEVAAAITVDPSVGQAVVIAADLPQLGKSLIGYLTAADGQPDSVELDRIRARVTAALPDYMVPAAYVVVDEIPITVHGKVDRAALPPPQIEAATEYREPETAIEQRIAGLFAQLLGRTSVGVDDSFFELGGHSLTATKLATAIRSECGVDIDIREVFELSTVGRLAERVEALRTGPVALRRPKLIATAHDEPSPASGRYPQPLSAAQLRIWFTYRVEGPSPVNNIPFAARLTGPCNVEALVAAITDVVGRHEILRTTYREIGGVPYQVVNPPTDVPVRQTAGEGEAWLQEELDTERRQSFELDHDWPIRAAVLHTRTGQDHVVSLVVHHIAGDHWSGEVMFADLLTAYRARCAGEDPSWAPLPVQYADYAAWQVALLSDDDRTGAERDYWTQQLAGLPEDTGLRPDFPRRPVPSGDGEAVKFRIDGATRGKIAGLCRELGITEFMLLQSAVAVMLHKAGGGQDIPLGAPVAGRTESELDHLVGFFVNVLVLRNDLRGNPTLREVLARAREMALAGYAHSDLPFDRVVEAISPVRSLSRNPLFQVVVHVRDQPPAAWTIATPTQAGGTPEPCDTVFSALEPTFDIAHADLSVNFFATGTAEQGGYHGQVIFRTELYRRATIERMAGWLTQVITAFADNVDQTLRDVRLIDAAEERRMLTTWSRGSAAPDDRPLTIPGLLESSRGFGADRIAVRCGNQQIDYPALHRRSDNFAALLAGHGVGPGSLVGLSTRRGIDLVVALVGIMKAGAGYFPIDPGYPLARKRFMLDDVEPGVIVCTAETLNTMPKPAGVTLISLDDPAIREALDAESSLLAAALPQPHPDDPMYLVFTSGSTGSPKGVLGTHRAMTTRLNWQLLHYPVPGNDIRLAQASMTFLEGSMEMLAGLAAGATMILADDTEHRDPEALASLIQRNSVTQVTAVASLVSTLVDTPPQAGGTPRPEALRSLTRLVCSGEPVTMSLLQRLMTACTGGPELLNNFGATETSGGLVRGPLTPPVPLLGMPTPDSQVYLLDDALQPVPVGVIGELYYAGGQLARGYWKRPGLTASRFVPNPYSAEPGARFYRSGDLARWTDDGRLEFVGRADHQVKIRGFRVELGEIEAALKATDGVAIAAARTWETAGSTMLAGYVVPHRPTGPAMDETDKAVFADSVRVAIAATLPGYAMPSSITVLDAMPKTESGKLNRPGLPRPTANTRGQREPPRTDTERALATVFAEVLSTGGVGRFDDFFTLGGDSICSVRLAARARAAGLSVSPQMVFEHPTVQQLAAALDTTPASTEQPGHDPRYGAMSASGLSSGELAALQASWGGDDAGRGAAGGGSGPFSSGGDDAGLSSPDGHR